MSSFDKDVQKTLVHVRYLSETIGGRGSCTEQELQAGEYVTRQLRAMSIQDISSEPFDAVPSTYWGFALAFTAALTGSLLVMLYDGRGVLALAALLNAVGVWGMLAETEFASSWVRWTLPRKGSRNIAAKIPPQGPSRRNVVLCAHVDTHRTPTFYASKTWYMLFTALVTLSFLSMVVGMGLYTLGAAFAWEWVRWFAVGLVVIQFFGVGMCLQADFTPYSPGANDNASGVGTVLALAARLRAAPLTGVTVHLLFTGCEEVGDYGIRSYLDRHAAELGPETVYIILDEVGLGEVKYLNVDGLLLKRRTHPLALQLARDARQQLPDLKIREGPGMAYNDALPVTKRGLAALTVCTVPAKGSERASHWHRMSDRVETLVADDLAAAFEFTWTILQLIDRGD